MLLRQYIKGDRIIWLVIVILFAFSLLSVYTSTDALAYRKMSGDTFYFLVDQLKYIIGGLVVIFIVHLLPYNFFKSVSGLVLVISIFLLAYTLVKGQNLNEANRWIGIGGKTFQPSEIAKIALIMYMARVLSINQNNVEDFKKVFLKLIVAIALVCGLIFPANLSTAVIVFTIAFALMFIGRIPYKYLFMIVGIGVVVGAFFILVMQASDEENRSNTWISRVETFVTGEGNSDQADAAKVAIVRGGFLPNGPGTSKQRTILPHSYSDFIFAIIIEEYGSILGGLVLIVLYLWLLFRTGLIVRQSKSTFAAFLAYGLALSLVFQAFVNMGVAVGLLPVTGQTLPLVSKGGTSILTTSGALGMILSVSAGIRAEESADREPESEAEEESSETEEMTNERETDI